MFDRYLITTILTLLTPVLLLFVMFLMGGGHGFYEPAIVLFPTGLVSLSIFHEIIIPFRVLAVIQFPLYGLLIDKSRDKYRTLLLIIGFHLALALITFFALKDTL
jgi:hypothetical protein